MTIKPAQVIVSSRLKPLANLQKLSIDLHLAPPTIHFYHASFHGDQNLFSCHDCIQKYDQQTRDIEAEVSLRIAKELPNLKWVQWLSHFSANQRSLFHVQKCQEGNIVSVKYFEG